MKRLFPLYFCLILTLICGCLDTTPVPSDNTDVPPTLLPGQSMVDAPVDADYFFRDCDGEEHSRLNVICYSEPPYVDSRDFSSQQERLVKENVIPEISGYDTFVSNVHYGLKDEFYELSFSWHAYSGEKDNITLGILTKEPEDFSTYDGWYTVDYDSVTTTQIQSGTVYGERIDTALGTQTYLLFFTLPDGSYCQLKGGCREDLPDMITVLEFILEHGINYAQLTKDQGNHFISYSYDGTEPPQEDPYKNCRPRITGLPLIQTFGSEIVKNDEINYSLALQYELTDAGAETLSWDVDSEPPYFTQELNIGPLKEQSRETIMAALTKNDGAVAFEVEEYTISVHGYGAPNELLMAMIETLPDYRKEEQDYSYLFASNNGQAGDMPGICGTGAPPSRDFSKHISALMAENAIPVVRIGSSPTVKVEYWNQEPCHIWMKWQEGPEVVILPPNFREGYVYVVDEAQCSSHEIDGFTVYADGTESSEKKALITTFPDGSTLQVVGDQQVSANVLGEVLRYFLEHGINYDAYQMDKGDLYDHVSLEDLPELFQPLIPETPEDWYIGMVMLRVREDLPISAELTYYHDGQALEWAILTETEYMRDYYLSTAANDLENLTVADVEQLWGMADFRGGCFHGGLYLSIQTYQEGLAEELYGMMQSVIIS